MISKGASSAQILRMLTKVHKTRKWLLLTSTLDDYLHVKWTTSQFKVTRTSLPRIKKDFESLLFFKHTSVENLAVVAEGTQASLDPSGLFSSSGCAGDSSTVTRVKNCNSTLNSSEQSASADVCTTCGWVCCMIPGSHPPPRNAPPICGISCTCDSSSLCTVSAFVLPRPSAQNHSTSAHRQGSFSSALSSMLPTHPVGTKPRYRYAYDVPPVLWPHDPDLLPRCPKS